MNLMKNSAALLLVIAVGSGLACSTALATTVLAEVPVTPATARDRCFDQLRGTAESSARRQEMNVVEMLEGYAVELGDGSVQCKARFLLLARDNQRADTGHWFQASAK
ncbi:hypothetical protein [Pseudomonas abietaniphila]|uniref:Lipoprotein n=1 Tax=Pseudomonas abietaniphila TaxID=89065 RepID=A0A1G8RSG9_9PSED|nr:hypothetical protein [Pseudomonas abietaniphila]SDJ19882.1 hypothetical protein SAMN05216605_12341 [Pseudomonas abietaniphila]